MIIERTKVREAYERAARLGATHEEALASAAQSLGLQVEVVLAALQPAEEEFA